MHIRLLLFLECFLALVSLEQQSFSVISATISDSIYSNTRKAPPFTVPMVGGCQVWSRIFRSSRENQNRMEIWTSGKSILVAFRGTVSSSIGSIFQNFDVAKVGCSLGNVNCGNVHRGQLRIYNSFSQALRDQLEKADFTSITFTGHSLGGALASLAAVDMQPVVKGRKTRIITYGMPMVGDDGFSKAVSGIPNADITRYVMTQKLKKSQEGSLPFYDRVSNYPPADWGYRHYIQASGIHVQGQKPRKAAQLHKSKEYAKAVNGFVDKSLIYSCKPERKQTVTEKDAKALTKNLA